MNTVKLYYFRHRPNLGDLLGVNIIEKMFGKKVVYSPLDSCELISIGSILGEFISNRRDRNLNHLFARYFSPELKVWGSGFIEPEGDENEYFSRKMRFFALRGKLSLERVKKICKKEKKFDEIVLGDPGILSSCLIEDKPRKRYRLGIVPHFVDRNEPVIGEINERIKGSTIIDICKDPVETVRTISECELIISSAMHSLIAADSLGIPNMRIKISDRIIGGDYKFKDYYSAYDIDVPGSIDLREHRFIEDDLRRIESSYKIKQDDVTRIKNRIFEAFPFK